MSKQRYVEIPFPAKEFDELTAEARKLGFKNLDEFAEKATREYLEKQRREAESK